MGVHITTIDYLRVLIIEIGSTIILMVVEAQGLAVFCKMPAVVLALIFLGEVSFAQLSWEAIEEIWCKIVPMGHCLKSVI